MQLVPISLGPRCHKGRNGYAPSERPKKGFFGLLPATDAVRVAQLVSNWPPPQGPVGMLLGAQNGLSRARMMGATQGHRLNRRQTMVPTKCTSIRV